MLEDDCTVSIYLMTRVEKLGYAETMKEYMT